MIEWPDLKFPPINLYNRPLMDKDKDRKMVSDKDIDMLNMHQSEGICTYPDCGCPVDKTDVCIQGFEEPYDDEE